MIKAINKSQRDRVLKHRYGINQEDYDALFKKQGNVCAICKGITSPKGNKTTMYVDHCHTTGKVRGILCPKCNQFLGFLETGMEQYIFEAFKYLNGGDRPLLPAF